MPRVYGVVMPRKYNGGPPGRKPNLKRGRKILALRRSGQSLQKISDYYHISKQRVDQVINYMLERIYSKEQARLRFKEKYDLRYDKCRRRL